MNVAIVPVGVVVFRLVENTLGRVIDVAMKLEEISLPGWDGTEEGIGTASTRDLFDKCFAFVLINFFQRAVMDWAAVNLER